MSQDLVIRVHLEIGKAKKLYQHPDVAQIVSPAITVQTVGHGNHIFSTRVAEETTDPFFNETFDLSIPCPAAGIASVQFSFEVKDCTKEDSPLLIGCGSFGIRTAVNIPKKEELIVDVQPPKDMLEGSTGQFGTVTFRYRVQVPKRHEPVEDTNSDIDLPFVPKFSAAYSLVPLFAPFAWWSLTQDPTWNDKFSRVMLHCYANEKLDKKNPLKSVGDIVVVRWKCKRTHQVFTKLRICAEKFIKRESKLEFSPEEEITEKRKWKELSLIRAKQHGQQRSKKVLEVIDKLWLHYCTDVHYDTTPSHIGFELRDRMNTTNFARPQYEVLVSAILSFFLPTLPQSVCDLIAREDFPFDKEANPSAAQKELERVDQLAAQVAAESGQVLTTARAAVAELILRHTERQFADTSVRPSSTPSAQMFSAVLFSVADFWADTMTDAEQVALTLSLGTAVSAAKQRVSLPSNPAPSGGRGSSARPRRPTSTK